MPFPPGSIPGATASPSRAEAAAAARLNSTDRSALPTAVMVASGFAGLGSQIAWTQQAAHWLGHDGLAVLAVVGAFFGGLALGALALGERIHRNADPGRWYAGCELVIALWSAVLALGLAPACRALMLAAGPQPAAAAHALLALLGVFLLLLPATAAMGATLPAMQRLVAGNGRPEAAIGRLYAANTAGAVLGVLAAAFWLVPAIGLTRTAALCALLNAACAVGVLAWRRRAPAALATPPTDAPAARRRWWLPLAATGALGIGFELLVVRVLRQVAENTVYTFALLLAVYLVATAIGAALWQRAQGRHAAAAGADADAPLLLALAAACTLGGASLWQAVAIKAAVLRLLGPSMGAALAAEAVLAGLAFGLLAACMGAVFSQLCSRARAAGIGLGRSLGINTLGAATAPLLVGVALLPAIGAKLTLLLLVAGYLALLPWRGATRWPGAALAGVLAAAAWWAPPLRIVDLPEGARLVQYLEGAQAAVSIVEDAQGVARLHIDNRQQEGSSHTRLADGRQALLPLLLHPAPRRALFLGLGTGITASTAAGDTRLRVDAVELLPEVITASAHFTAAPGGDAPHPLPNPRLHLLQADARRHVRVADVRYDLVVADNFHPARSGSAALYTVEHFRAVGARLAPGGVFCQWLPLHQLDLDSLRAIVAAFLAAHPQAQALLATHSLDTPVLGLLARADGQPFDAVALRRRLAEASITPPPADFGLPDDLAVLGSLVAGPQALAAFAGSTGPNTDDRPVVAYLAPRITYAPDSTPRQRLMALLAEFRRQPLQPMDLVNRAPEPGWHQRLAAYWQARDAFLAAGMAVRPAADVRQMLAQVQQPLLAVLRTSADFRPAYDPLLQMAGTLAASDVPAARTLLAELQRLQPARPEAALLLRQIGPP